MKLRVAFLNQSGSSLGGAEQTLLTFLKHAPPEIEPSMILFEDGAFAERLRALGLAVEIVPVPSSISGSTRERVPLAALGRIPTVAVRVASILKRRRIELLYTNSMKAHFVGAAAARLAATACVMHFHDLIEGRPLDALRSAARLGSRERIACSRMVAERIHVPATTVIYAPLELAAYASLPDRAAARRTLGIPDDGRPLVAIVGRINRWKGVDRFVRIAARVRERVDARFAIVGAPIFRDADVVPELEAQVRALRLDDRLTFVPWLDDVRAIYAVTDVNANCSTREPFGRAIIEAGACGVPTVCFDDSGAAETIADGVNGRLVPAGDESAFADAIVAYLADPHRLDTARAAARARVAPFDAPLIADAMARVIRRAAA